MAPVKPLPDILLDAIISALGPKVDIDEAEYLVEEILRLVLEWVTESIYE